MKKIIIIFSLVFCANLSAQSNTQSWLTDYNEAIKISESLNNPILVFVTDNSNGESLNVLREEVFNSEEFNSYASSFVLLKLDTSADSYNKRLAKHYSKSDVIPSLSLVDKQGNLIGNALTVISSEAISKFMELLKTKTK